MARESSSGIPFFSTHPPSSERADLLRHMLPMALSRYEKSGASGAGGNRSFSSLNNVSSVNPSVNSTGLTVQNFVRKNRSDNANLKMQIDNARVLLSQSKFIDAENVLRNIIKDDSTNPEAVYLLGFSLLEQKKNKEAREFLSKAVGLNFNNPAPFYDFARLKSRNGDNQNAIVYLIRACSLDNSLRKRAANDPDFQRMRNDERFRRIVDR
jgi:predicted Zn-dependent protease